MAPEGVPDSWKFEERDGRLFVSWPPYHGWYQYGSGPWCGTPSGYMNHKCKCDECTDAWRDSHRAYMSRSAEQRERHSQRMRELRRRRRP